MNNKGAMNNKDELVLECINVSKAFKDVGTRLEVLKQVNLQVTRGQQVAIVGKSGSGKTTLLQLLAGLDITSAGQVKLNGQDLQKLTADQRGELRNKSLGFIYQLHHLLPEFSALENIALPLLIRNESISKIKQEAIKLLKAVDLLERQDHKPAQLSGGERQRIAIARALVTYPDCVLADEPTGNLDSENADVTFELMRKLNREYGTTFIIVTHDQELAAKLDQTYSLQEGQLVAIAS